jgi:alkanesulfonate monooxygenase SsuD/methylene tetrahydromethanopterin reductase-like flavin-dependent oxidoreductase (luciferase family)
MSFPSARITVPPAVDKNRPFKLGFLTHVHGRGDPKRIYADLLELFIAADALGFDGGWIAQHHLREAFGRLPSPLVFLAAAAERTRHIELGTGIIVAPLEDPLRLAEDAAVLDAISGGRVQLGLGTGGANLDVFGAFGINAEARHSRFQKSVDILQKAFSGHRLTPPDADASNAEASGAIDGGGTLQPPAPGLLDRIWHSHSSVEGARFAAERGNGLLLGTAVHDPLTVQLPLVQSYLSHAAALTGSSRPPKVGTVRAVFPSSGRQAALAELAPDVVRHIPWLTSIGHEDRAALTPERIVQLLNVHYGHPEEVIASLRADPALLGYTDYFIPVVHAESSTLEQALKRLRLIAETIAPALGWRPASRTTPGQASRQEHHRLPGSPRDTSPAVRC